MNGTVQVTVIYKNQEFGPAVAQVIFGSPGIFRLQIGQLAQAFAINQDGTLNGPMNPAQRGTIVAVWGTGYGKTNPPCPAGGLNVPSAAPLGPGISALIRRVFVYDAFQDLFQGISDVPVQYAGIAPSMVCGVEQINFQVPLDVAPGGFFFLPWVQFADTTTLSQYQPPLGATIAVK